MMFLNFLSLAALTSLATAAPGAVSSEVKPVIDKTDHGVTFQLFGTIKGQKFEMEPVNTQFFFNEFPNVYCKNHPKCTVHHYRETIFNLDKSDGSMTLNARAPFYQVVYVDPTGALRYFVEHEVFYNVGSSYKSWEIYEPAAGGLILNYFKDGKDGTEMPFYACSLHHKGDFTPGPGYQIFIGAPKGFSRSDCLEFTPTLEYTTDSRYAWGK